MRIFILFLHVISCAWFQNVTKFICNSGHSISITKVCDGEQDCIDRTDETYHLCRHTLCPLDKFRCYYGACVPKNSRCDGTKHCADGSDENQCGIELHDCKQTEYRCSTGECISLEKLCDGYPDCKQNSDEGNICEKINACPIFTHRCSVGSCIYLNQRCDGRRDCIDGSDESEILCGLLNCTKTDCKFKVQKPVYCPPIKSDRMNVQCKVPFGKKAGLTSCNHPLSPGTVVYYDCKPFYVPANVRHLTNKKTLCQLDGNWNREVLKCIPDCGRQDNDVALLIIKGWTAYKRNFPWHAILFTLEEGQWIFICGGTLISEKIVITAAHCIWNIPKELFQVALGKLYSDFYKVEDFQQLQNISQIIVQPAYQDLEGNYGSDIAILVLNRMVKFSASVRPACVDWNLNDISEHLTPNNLGLIAGMGITENNTFSDKLNAVYLPVVNNSYCIRNQKKDFKKYVTFTSFCAGWRNGSGVCNGDSGGGLVFPSKQNPSKFTIQGIVSVSPRRPGTSFCDPNYYTVFTKVGIYVQWIYDILQNIHSNTDTDDVIL